MKNNSHSFSINKIYEICKEVCKRTYEENHHAQQEKLYYDIAYSITLEILKVIEYNYGYDELSTIDRPHYGGDWIMYEWNYLIGKIKRSKKLKKFDFFIPMMASLEKVENWMFYKDYLKIK